MLSQPDKQYADDADSGNHMWYSDGEFLLTNVSPWTMCENVV